MLVKFMHEADLALRGIAININRQLVRFENRLSVTYVFHLFSMEPLPYQLNGETTENLTSRRRRYLEKCLQAAAMSEFQKYSSSGQHRLRQEMSSEPFLRNCSAQSGTPNTDINYNNRISPQMTGSSLRQRSFDVIPIAFLIFVSSHIIASSQDARAFINARATKGAIIPRVLHEALLSTRSSTVGRMYITPTFSALSVDFLESLNLKNTILDAEYLVTQAGITRLFDLYARLNQMQDNYVAFVPFEAAVPFNSGYMTTAMSWVAHTFDAKPIDVEYFSTVDNKTSLKTETVTTATIRVLGEIPFSSYGEVRNDVHLLDNYVMQRQLINESTQEAVNLGTFTSAEFSPVITTEGLSMYIVDRVCVENALLNSKSVRVQKRETEVTTPKPLDSVDLPSSEPVLLPKPKLQKQKSGKSKIPKQDNQSKFVLVPRNFINEVRGLMAFVRSVSHFKDLSLPQATKDYNNLYSLSAS